MDISSLLLLSELSSGWQMTINFLYKHRLHSLVLLEQGLNFLIIFRLVEYGISASFKV